MLKHGEQLDFSAFTYRSAVESAPALVIKRKEGIRSYAEFNSLGYIEIETCKMGRSSLNLFTNSSKGVF